MSERLQQLLEEIYGLEITDMKLGLDTMTKILSLLDNPHLKYKTIHVGGTNGKGSVCAMLASILKESGHTTGLFTSPHLFSFNERIQINNVAISDEELEDLILQVKHICSEHKMKPTFFEFKTVLGFLYFAKQNVDVAIIEVGMGGDLDATNVVQPVMSIITNVTYDHMKILGGTILEIAEKKAGIIKPTVSLVIGNCSAEVRAFLKEKCEAKESFLFESNVEQEIVVLEENNNSTTIKIVSRDFKIEFPLKGNFQLENLATVLKGIEVLQTKGFLFSNEHLQRGLEEVAWKGRFDIISREPFVLVDGAHNVAGFEQMNLFLKKFFSENKFNKTYCILALSEDRSVDITHAVTSFFDEIVVCEGVRNPKCCEKIVEELKLKFVDKKIVSFKDAKRAGSFVQEKLVSKDFVLVIGSLYMIPTLLNYFKKIYSLESEESASLSSSLM